MFPTSIAVVLLSKDEPSIAVSLDLLRPQCERLNARCFVIDASEGRMDSIRVANPWVTWIDYVKPFWRKSSIPHQRNVGVQLAGADIIAFCDAGGEPAHDWLENLTAPLLEGTYQYVCGPIVPSMPGSFETFNPSPTGTVTINAPTANVAFTRAAFNQVGGFDERYNYGSDNDLLLRLRNEGIECFVIREAAMDMPWGDIGLNLRRAWRWGRGAGRIVRYHPAQRWTWLRVHPATLFWSVMIVVMVATMAALFSVQSPWVLLPGMFLTLFWITKNRKTPRLDRVAIDHVIQALAFDFELASSLVPRGPRIALVGDTASDVAALQEACCEVGNPTTVISLRNIVRLVWLRCRGLRLLVLMGQPTSRVRYVSVVCACLRIAVHSEPLPDFLAHPSGVNATESLQWARKINGIALQMHA